MKRKISFILVFAIISSAAWMSCQKIDDPLVVVSHNSFPNIPDDTTGGDTTADNYISTYVDFRQVLLEEFTGHLCVNCPEAATMAHELAEDLDHKLVIYSVHAGNFAVPEPGTAMDADFRNPVSTALYNDFQIFANPLALIDRAQYNGLRWIQSNDWQTVVMNELEKPNVANMRLSNTFFPNLNVVKVEVETEFTEQVEGQYKLAVYIAEDSIVAPQLNNNPSIGEETLFNYVHRNVLRDAITATYGEFIGDDGNITAGEVYKNQYTYSINNDWVTKNCRIIAYVGKFDESLNLVDIVQVAELEIKVGE